MSSMRLPSPVPDGPLVGRVLELEVGPAAHGGFCVARHEGRVVFVRHALPGERVRARVTEDRGGSFCRADAIEVLAAVPGRVAPPCPHAGPGRCGGCDWQHADAATQRRIKGEVVREQFRRIAGLDVADLCADAEALPGGLLGWRTRIAFAVGPDGEVGLHRHRSHHLEPIEACPLGRPGVGDSAVLDRTWPGLNAIEAVAGSDGVVTVLEHRPGPGRQARGRRPPDRVRIVDGPSHVRYRVAGQEFTAAADGFWQVHPAAADTFLAALLDAVAPRPGESVLELYCGAGALTAGLADAVGPTGRVLGIEASGPAVADAEANLADRPWAEFRRARVESTLLAELSSAPDLVVLDPPRTGAGPDVITALLALAPRAIGYVACDPAALARDVQLARAQGWRLTRLRIFDAFPMTHHIECVAVLEPPIPPSSRPGPGDTTMSALPRTI
jgi:tRNA/tmRNA/rRNA uracil-C5-methylase (TrmA/RlmC/RlmD family)